jgi:hypothetical protein
MGAKSKFAACGCDINSLNEAGTKTRAGHEDLVAFTRALKRVLQNDTGDFERKANISVQHEKVSNAESDVISITFPDGRGIELHVGTLDNPNQLTKKRDFVTADETLASGQ